MFERIIFFANKYISLSFFHSVSKREQIILTDQYLRNISSAEVKQNSFLVVMMEQNLENYDLSVNSVNIQAPLRLTKFVEGESSNKCNQCEFASLHASSLRVHLKTHSGEKSNKCNQCDFASSYASALSAHLKIHSGERSNKCNQ